MLEIKGYQIQVRVGSQIHTAVVAANNGPADLEVDRIPWESRFCHEDGSTRTILMSVVESRISDGWLIKQIKHCDGGSKLYYNTHQVHRDKISNEFRNHNVDAKSHMPQILGKLVRRSSSLALYEEYQ